MKFIEYMRLKQAYPHKPKRDCKVNWWVVLFIVVYTIVLAIGWHWEKM